MKKLSLYLFIVFCIATFNSCAQISAGNLAVTNTNTLSNDTFRLDKTIAGNFNMLEVDVLNNIYLITASNQLKKLNANGDSVAVFNDVKKYGNPSQMDVTNPLKVLLYYKNYSTVVILDRLLNQRNSINFRQHNIFSVKAIATSYDNNIWLFDEQNIKLKKIDESGNPLMETTDWRQIMDEIPSPVSIIDHNNLVYLYDPNKGFYIFGYYGTYKNNLPFLNWDNISISNKHLNGFSNGQFFSYELQSLNLVKYTLPSFFKNYISIKGMNGKIYLLKKDGIEIYSVLK